MWDRCAGRKGGQIVAAGSFDDILHANSITADYLTGRRRIEIPEKLRPRATGKSLVIRGARGNNLKNVDVEFPLGKLICVTGVSGSGKSDAGQRNPASDPEQTCCTAPTTSRSITIRWRVSEHIDKLVVVDQAPIGRSPRSNPATYSNVFSDIRKLFEIDARRPDPRVQGGALLLQREGRPLRGVPGCRSADYRDEFPARCLCHAARPAEATVIIGRRSKSNTKGKNIDDVLNMTVNMAVEFFANIPSIHQKLKAIQDVGLGYLTLGQPCTTLSGGESQRIKLSSELSKRDTGRTLYILDEPTTGLHFEDIRQLLDVLAKLVDRGNTVIVIEHNLDVIKVADHLIDIGPEGGEEGGRIVATGTPAEVARCPESYTGRFLQKLGL